MKPARTNLPSRNRVAKRANSFMTASKPRTGRVAAERLDANSNDGRIEAVDILAVNGALTTHDGRINVSFTGDSDATVNVKTSDGTVHVHGLPTTDDSDTSSVVHLGSGRGHFEVATNDGSINITRGANTHA